LWVLQTVQKLRFSRKMYSFEILHISSSIVVKVYFLELCYLFPSLY
jgi:hypothetical protein